MRISDWSSDVCSSDLIAGFLTGVLTFTPYYHWRWEHAIHHSTTAHLDKRGTGDIWTMTVQEYLEASRWQRFASRLSRNPVVLFVLAPLFVFLLMQRVPKAKAGVRERHSVWWTNLGRSEEHTSELQSLMSISYTAFCLKKKHQT